DLLMRRPSGAWIVEWMYTSWNGTSPRWELENIIIRATQRLMMSRAVQSTPVGWKWRRSAVSSGQPSVAWSHMPELNHVSSTSSSRRHSALPHSGHGCPPGPSMDTCTWDSSAVQYQTGSWWPHHSWRDRHQGLRSSIQP